MSKELRYRILDECFQSLGGYTTDELIDMVIERLRQENDNVGYAVRTFQEDVRKMKFNPKFAEQLENGCFFQKKKGGNVKIFRYEDRSFSYFESALDAEQKVFIKQAVNFLFKIDTKSLTWLDEITKELEIFRDDHESKVIFFDERQRSEIQYSFKFLYDIIVNKNVVEFTYKQINSKNGQKFKVSPYFLKQFDQKWYLIGRRHENAKADLERFPLSGIVEGSLQRNPNEQLIPLNIDPNEYFNERFGVEDYGKNPTKIIIRIKKSLDEKLKDKPIQRGQKYLKSVADFNELKIREKITNAAFYVPSEKDFDNYFFIQLNLEYNIKLQKLFLSYGKDLTVIYPYKLREKLKKEVKSILDNYSRWTKDLESVEKKHRFF